MSDYYFLYDVSVSFEIARRTTDKKKTNVIEIYLKSGSPVIAHRQFRTFFYIRETADRRTHGGAGGAKKRIYIV